jgi:hypothetical protein
MLFQLNIDQHRLQKENGLSNVTMGCDKSSHSRAQLYLEVSQSNKTFRQLFRRSAQSNDLIKMSK